MQFRNSVFVPLAAIGKAIGQPALAAEPDRWQYEITRHLLATAMNGPAGVKGLTVPVDASFSDILENTGAELGGPVAGVVSANVDTRPYIGQGPVGYRRRYWDHEDGGTVWDTSASGPCLGLGIRF